MGGLHQSQTEMPPACSPRHMVWWLPTCPELWQQTKPEASPSNGPSPRWAHLFVASWWRPKSEPARPCRKQNLWAPLPGQDYVGLQRRWRPLQRAKSSILPFIQQVWSQQLCNSPTLCLILLSPPQVLFSYSPVRGHKVLGHEPDPGCRWVLWRKACTLEPDCLGMHHGLALSSYGSRGVT